MSSAPSRIVRDHPSVVPLSMHFFDKNVIISCTARSNRPIDAGWLMGPVK